MKNLNIIYILLTYITVAGVAFAAGHFTYPLNTPSTPTTVTSEQAPNQEVAKSGSAVLYGKIDNIKANKENKDIDFHLVEWVNGSDNQEQAAFETGLCTLDRIENDECLPNHFFVRNTQKNISLPISKDVLIKIYARNDKGGMKSDEIGNIYQESVSLEALNTIIGNVETLKEVPFIFTTTQGVITEIQEQYIP